MSLSNLAQSGHRTSDCFRRQPNRSSVPDPVGANIIKKYIYIKHAAVCHSISRPVRENSTFESRENAIVSAAILCSAASERRGERIRAFPSAQMPQSS